MKPQLRMRRPDLRKLPPVRLPEGCALRSYRPGDDAHWVRIIAESFGEEADHISFEQRMRTDPAFRPERVFFITKDDDPVATASAYYKPTEDPAAGVLHYVGVLTEHHGRKLGYWVCLAALHRMAAEGRAAAWLSTDDFRAPAIKTYLNLGFLPLLVHENQRERWRRVLAGMGLTELLDAFGEILEGPVRPPPSYPSDSFDYPRLTVAWRRGQPRRRPGRPGGLDCDAFADESLYKPGSLGTAGASIDSVPAGTDRPFELWFRAGPAGLPEGTRVRFYTAGQKPLGTAPQSRDSKKPGFVEVSRRPSAVDIRAAGAAFRLVRGALEPGAEVRLAVGREHGFAWTPLAGRKEFKIIIDPGHGERFMRLPEPVVVRVQPLGPDHVDVFLPPNADPESPVRATISVRDRFDNRVPLAGPISVALGELSRIIHLCDGLAQGTLGAMGPCPVQAHASLDALPGTHASNVCLPSGELNLYFGDLHVHDFTCAAEGYTGEVYRWGREDKRLDFMSLSVQTHSYLDNDKWAIHKHMAEAFLDEGRFVTFLAFEWQHSHYGDKVVHYLGGDQPYLPIDQSRYAHPLDLYEALRGSDALIISHHPGYALELHVPGTDCSMMQTDIDRLVELWSMHGSSEGYDPEDRPLVGPRREGGVLAALREGLRVGFVGGSDTHGGRPCGSAKEPRPYWGGYCGVWASSLTRRALFAALHARRTYALTKARIALRFTVNDSPMGSEIAAAERARIGIDVWAPSAIAHVQVMKNGTVLRTLRPDGSEFHLELEDSVVAAAFYHCRVTLRDGSLAVCSPVWVG